MRKRRFRLTITDFVVCSLLVLLFVFFAYRIKVGLNYNWAWDLIPQFIFRQDNKSFCEARQTAAHQSSGACSAQDGCG